MRAIRVHETGGPDVLRVEELPDPEPGEGEVRVRVGAAGVNFVDTYQRSGAYARDLPFVPGSEMAGVVDLVGPGVDGIVEGQRVACCTQPGAYAEYLVAGHQKLVAVPDHVSTEIAAAVLLQGMTAHYLATSTYELGPDDTALVYAAAGGVGHLLVQIAKLRGARVIATASSQDKAELARRDGADEVVFYRDVDLEEAVRDLTGGEGVDVVYDSVGKDTFDISLRLLRPRGMLVLYGQSSGAVPPFDGQRLNSNGSLYLTRPSLGHYLRGDELETRSSDLFGWIASGDVGVRIDRSWPLSEAADAHRYMEEGRTHGKLLLIP